MSARTRPYQRRRRGPVIAVVVVLGLAVLATWTTVLLRAGGVAGGAACPPPVDSPPREVLPVHALDAVPPVPPTSARTRVLNAGGQRGQANLVAAQLGDLGFAQASPPDNDPLFPDGTMQCTAEIRFGPAGQGAASTVVLVLPCAELVRDGRADDTVDIAVGTSFGDLNPSRAARDVLEQLGAPASGSDGASNADPSGSESAPSGAPTVDEATLSAARDAVCG